MSHRAPFIVLEGPEGAGKSLQAIHLGEWLELQGWDVLQVREPGGSAAGDAIRGLLLQSDHLHLMSHTEALLLAAARTQLVHEMIIPALERNTAVVCDRYIYSTYAYQGGGRGLPMDELESLQQFATGGLLPDIRLLLDLPVEIGLGRRYADAEQLNRLDRAPLDFHQRVRATYLELAANDPASWDIIDASIAIEDVAAAIQTAVARRLADWPMSVSSECESTNAS